MARPDFRAAAARRLAEEHELSPAIVSLLSPDSKRQATIRTIGLDQIEPNPEQPRLCLRPDVARRAGGVRAGARCAAADPRAPPRRTALPADRRRAPLARVTRSRPPDDPGPGRGDRRRHGARDRDHREPAARGPLAARRSSDVRPDDPGPRLQHPEARREARARTRDTSRTDCASPTRRRRSANWCPCAKTPSRTRTSC